MQEGHKTHGGVSAENAALGAMLEAAHVVAPDQLGWLVSAQARRLGVDDCALFLVDYEQRRLVPLATGGLAVREPLDVDTTMAGRAFQHVEILESMADPRPRLWIPLLDGTERLGVIEFTFASPDDLDDAVRDSCRHLAALTAELVVSKSLFSDVFTQTRRLRPMSLPAEIQRNLLPPLTLVTPQVTISAALEPAYDVAGDAFDYAVNGPVAHVAVFDAMGHGLEASLLASLAVGAYRHSRRQGLGLEPTLASMDAAISAQFGQERFVTALLGELRLDTGRLRWLIAGHPPPLLVRGGRVVAGPECEPTLPVGLGGEVVEVAELQLEPGDRLLAFTDGVIEARAPDGGLFGTDRLVDLLQRSSASGLPAPETMRRLTHAVLEWQSEGLRDDATLLFVEWMGRGEELESRARSAPELW